jgi:monoamine oxidase
VKVITNKRTYRCSKVIWSVPLATSCNIKVSRLSESKRMLFENQEFGIAAKLFMIFKRPFWRTTFCGNAYFSEEFPFS